MNSRPKDPKTARNKNVLVIGGSGSGKTRFWLKPNLMQMHSSYVVTDPKGTILVECGKMLQRGTPKLGKDGKPMKDKHGKVIYEPYRIKVLNTINFKKSIVSIRRNCPYGAIGVQSGQSPKNNKKRRTAGIGPRKPGGRLLRLLYAYE